MHKSTQQGLTAEQDAAQIEGATLGGARARVATTTIGCTRGTVTVRTGTYVFRARGQGKRSDGQDRAAEKLEIWQSSSSASGDMTRLCRIVIVAGMMIRLMISAIVIVGRGVPRRFPMRRSPQRVHMHVRWAESTIASKYAQAANRFVARRMRGRRMTEIRENRGRCRG